MREEERFKREEELRRGEYRGRERGAESQRKEKGDERSYGEVTPLCELRCQALSINSEELPLAMCIFRYTGHYYSST